MWRMPRKRKINTRKFQTVYLRLFSAISVLWCTASLLHLFSTLLLCFPATSVLYASSLLHLFSTLLLCYICSLRFFSSTSVLWYTASNNIYVLWYTASNNIYVLWYTASTVTSVLHASTLLHLFSGTLLPCNICSLIYCFSATSVLWYTASLLHLLSTLLLCNICSLVYCFSATSVLQ